MIDLDALAEAGLANEEANKKETETITARENEEETPTQLKFEGSVTQADANADGEFEDSIPSPASLLALPTEVRLRIFRHLQAPSLFADEADKYKYDEKFEREREVSVNARKNLMLVCRQITEEWAPIFYSTTTIVVNTLKRPSNDDEHDEKELGLYLPTSHVLATPTEFADLFLSKLDKDSKLRYIARLDYDASVWKTDPAYGHIESEPPFVNFPAIRDLGSVLCQYRQDFKWLSEINVSEELNDTAWGGSIAYNLPERVDVPSASSDDTATALADAYDDESLRRERQQKWNLSAWALWGEANRDGKWDDAIVELYELLREWKSEPDGNGLGPWQLVYRGIFVEQGPETRYRTEGRIQSVKFTFRRTRNGNGDRSDIFFPPPSLIVTPFRF